MTRSQRPVIMELGPANVESATEDETDDDETLEDPDGEYQQPSSSEDDSVDGSDEDENMQSDSDDEPLVPIIKARLREPSESPVREFIIPEILRTPTKPVRPAKVIPTSTSRKRALSSSSVEESPTRRIRIERENVSSTTTASSFQVPDDMIFSPSGTQSSNKVPISSRTNLFRHYVDLTLQDSDEESSGGDDYEKVKGSGARNKTLDDEEDSPERPPQRQTRTTRKSISKEIEPKVGNSTTYSDNHSMTEDDSDDEAPSNATADVRKRVPATPTEAASQKRAQSRCPTESPCKTRSGRDSHSVATTPSKSRHVSLDEMNFSPVDGETYPRLERWIGFRIIREAIQRFDPDLEAWLPLEGPDCQVPDCEYRVTKLRITAADNVNGNGGRPYYTCMDGHWVTWADLKDVDGPNCYCGIPSRGQINNSTGRKFWKCAGADCRFSWSDYSSTRRQDRRHNRW